MYSFPEQRSDHVLLHDTELWVPLGGSEDGAMSVAQAETGPGPCGGTLKAEFRQDAHDLLESARAVFAFDPRAISCGEMLSDLLEHKVNLLRPFERRDRLQELLSEPAVSLRQQGLPLLSKQADEAGATLPLSSVLCSDETFSFQACQVMMDGSPADASKGGQVGDARLPTSTDFLQDPPPRALLHQDNPLPA